MGDTDPTSQVLGVVSFLLKPITRHIDFWINAKEYKDRLREEMRDLKNAKKDVKSQVDAAEARKQNCKQEVLGWMEKVDEIDKEVNEIECRFNQRKRCLGCHPNCWSTYKLGKKSKHLLQVVDDTNKKRSFTSVVLEGSLPPLQVVVEMPSTPAVGLEDALNKFKGLMREEEVEIICIHGMGGVGKTTLLKTINNEFVKENQDFVVVIWVTVPKGSPEVILREVQRQVGTRLGLHLPENIEELMQEIYKFLKQKKFMLLLDDLWETLDLDKVGIPHSSSSQIKSKIAFTTRSTKVCGGMRAHRRIKVEPLKDDEAWKLFQMNVGAHVGVDSSPILPHAKTIVGRCGGLPLALITVGRAMANKETINEWKDVVRALKNSPHELQEFEAKLFQVLKISYDNLPKETMKSCFLYCCLFPEGDPMSIGQLVDYYIGEGFFDEFSNAEDARNKAHSVIADLKAACLLEKDDDDEQRWVRFHDVMRHLAFWIASDHQTKNKILVHVHTEEPEVEDGKEMGTITEFDKWQDAERILLMDTGMKSLSENPNCPNLLTLILHKNQSLVHVSNTFFEYMPALKVLDLSMTNIEELPEGIDKLLELQYLNLMHTKIRSLPVVLKCLVKLKYLNLSYTNLSSNAYEVIPSFTKLQVLNLYHCSCENSEASVQELRRLKFLSTLGINMNSTNDINNFLNSARLLKCMRYLLISDCHDLLSIWLPSLQEEGKECLSSLEELTLEALPNVKINWPEPGSRRCLHHLRSVHIVGCHKLRDITWVLHLESLRDLHLSSCNGIEVLLGEGVTQEEGLLAFSKLREMNLRVLPKLKSIYSHALPFPCLKDLYILDCPKLKKLPLTAAGIKKNLQGICGRQEWWNQLDWEDENTKRAFTPYFRKWD
ncbi:hypothetical protein MRB53_011985 [Persea americana]|uniref:Uncharacterized protein n=1 Tax=Persea americana TaxID=3435 RepID=A0ACC2LWK6_PERAE|nr:hypothetical protein MRB53_011985 [Persea americana]